MSVVRNLILPNLPSKGGSLGCLFAAQGSIARQVDQGAPGYCTRSSRYWVSIATGRPEAPSFALFQPVPAISKCAQL